MGLDVVSTRYGAAAVDALAAVVARAKGSEPLRPVTVIVPSNYAGVAARRALARRHGVAGVAFVTLYRLAELLAGADLARSGRLPISSPVLATAFRAVLSQHPGLFAPVADEPSTVEALRRVHRELRDLSEAELTRLGQGDTRSREVVRIDREVTARLRSRWYDETDLMTAAVAQVAPTDTLFPLDPPDTGGFEHVVLHLPQRLSAAGARLLLALAEHGSVTVLLGISGDPEADAIAQPVLDRLGVAGAPMDPARPPGAPDAGGPAPARVEHIVAADEDDEVRTALRRLLLAAEEGTPLERMVVVYGPSGGYGRLLADHLTAARLPWNGIADVPVAERLAGRTLLGLLALDPVALRRRDVFALLASSPPTPERSTAAWERLARQAGVVAGRDQWEARLMALAAELRAPGGVAPQPWQVAQAEQADALRTFVATLAQRLQPPGEPTWAAHAAWARRLLTHVLGGEARRGRWNRDEQRAAERVDAILERLGRLDAVADMADMADMADASVVDRRAFQAALEAEMADGLTTVGRLGEGLFISPVSLAVGIDADVVVVLGLVEGCLPGGLGDDPLLSDASRRDLDGALPTSAERRLRLHHQLLAVAGAAQRVLVASRPRADLRSGRARYASRWLTGIDALGDLGRTHQHSSFPAGLHDGLPPASEQEAILGDLHRLAASHHPPELHPVAGTDDALRRGLTLVAARASERFTAFDGNLAELAAEGVDLGPRNPTSASALEAWAECPFAYFIHVLLGVREIDARDEELSLRPIDRGVLVHAVLDAVIAEQIVGGDVPDPGEPWSIQAQTDLSAALGAWCSEAEQRGVVGHPLLWRMEQRRLRRRLDAFVTLDRQARAALGVTPGATEMAFGYDAPFTIDLPDGRQLNLIGKVDRVDTAAGKAGAEGALGAADVVAVIDYKTGRAPSAWEPDPFAGGMRLQLPIYGMAARARLGRPRAEIAAEYWYLHDQRKDRGRRPVDVGPGTLDRLPGVLADIADAMAAGLFVPHPEEPNPWRRSRCACCDPDGADTTTVWSQWRSKQADPALAPYLRLIGTAPLASGDPP